MQAINALTYFLSNVELNMYSGNKPVNLMQLFPLVKQGIVNSEGVVALITIYGYVNNLISNNNIVLDELMKVAFASDIPATYFPQGRFGMIRMNNAIQRGIINYPLNTIEVLQLKDPQLVMINDGNIFIDADDGIRDIVEYNLDRYRTIDNIESDIKSEGKSLQSIAIVLSELHKLNTPDIRDVYSFIKFYLQQKIKRGRRSAAERITQNRIELVNKIITLPNIDLLCISIIFNNINDVKRFVTLFDPRDNNFRAYFLSIESGNQEIMNILKNNIIQRNLLEQEAFNTQIGNTTNLSKTLYNYAREL